MVGSADEGEEEKVRRAIEQEESGLHVWIKAIQTEFGFGAICSVEQHLYVETIISLMVAICVHNPLVYYPK